MGKLLKRPSPRSAKGKSRKLLSQRPKTLRELNRFLTREHDEILRKARANCLKLTGKETL
jgi:hypothetical protein